MLGKEIDSNQSVSGGARIHVGMGVVLGFLGHYGFDQVFRDFRDNLVAKILQTPDISDIATAVSVGRTFGCIAFLITRLPCVYLPYCTNITVFALANAIGNCRLLSDSNIW